MFVTENKMFMNIYNEHAKKIVLFANNNMVDNEHTFKKTDEIIIMFAGT